SPWPSIHGHSGCSWGPRFRRPYRADRQRLHRPAKGASRITEDGVRAAGAVRPDDRGRIQVDPFPLGVAVGRQRHLDVHGGPAPPVDPLAHAAAGVADDRGALHGTWLFTFDEREVG